MNWNWSPYVCSQDHGKSNTVFKLIKRKIEVVKVTVGNYGGKLCLIDFVTV